MSIVELRDLHISLMQMEEAKEICSWKYDGQYAMYNLDYSQDVLNELLNGDYYTVYIGDRELIGYYCFGKSAQVYAGRLAGAYNDKDYIDIGLGLRPDLTGRGLGREFLLGGLGFLIKGYGTNKARLTVTSFNKRAIKVYTRVGFREDKRFMKGDMEFITMKLV